jgi:RHS repeat-associated protein
LQFLAEMRFSRGTWTARLGLVLGVVIGAVPALADPRDPFQTSLPGRDFAPPEGQRGDDPTLVAETGAASYAIPIDVPPGRLGMQPRLALAYSSSGAIRGGVAVGWSLAVPIIERDPDAPHDGRFRTTLGGRIQRLVENDRDPGTTRTFRAEVDTDFTRFEHDPVGGWTARTTDGHTYWFSDTPDKPWRLTSESDALGNAISYAYETTTVAGYRDTRLVRVEYTINAAQNLTAHAKVELDYAPLELCADTPPAAAVDHHFGASRMTGARRLTAIRTSVLDDGRSAWSPARTYKLGYDVSQLGCSSSGLRYLTTVDIDAWDSLGNVTAAPTMRFGYGAMERSLDRTITHKGSPAERGTTRGATEAFMDLDGDARNDHVEILTGEKCQLRWRRGRVDGAFATDATVLDLPSVRWLNGSEPGPLEHCTLDGQVARRPTEGSTQSCFRVGVSVAYQFVDYDGDGVLDLLTALHGDPTLMNGDFFTDNPGGGGGGGSQCPTGMTETTIDGAPGCMCSGSGEVYSPSDGGCVDQVCSDGSSPNEITGSCTEDPSGIPTPPDPGGSPPGPSCGLADYRPEHTSSGAYVWRLYQRDATGYVPHTVYPRITSPVALSAASGATELRTPPAPGLPSLVDFDGDGWLDAVSTSASGSPEPPLLGISPRLYVWRGNGTDRFADKAGAWILRENWAPMAQSTTSEFMTPLVKAYTTTTTMVLRDVDADGLPDLVFNIAGEGWRVAYNMAGAPPITPPPAGITVHGAMSALQPFTFLGTVEKARSELTQWMIPTHDWLVGFRAMTRRMVDLDADGTLELFLANHSAGIETTASSRRGFTMRPGASGFTVGMLTPAWEGVESLIEGSGFAWTRRSDFVDLTGDGLPDSYERDPGGSMTIHTDVAPASLRLLTRIENGRGAITELTYAASNDADVVDLADRPASGRPVVAGVSVAPGAGQPLRASRYRYARPVRGLDGPRDPRAPGFLGFEEITIESSGSAGPASRRTVSTYGFFPLGNDFGGQLRTRSTEYLDGTVYRPLHHTSYFYGFTWLLDGSASTTFPTRTERRVCGAAESLAACASHLDADVTTEERQTWTWYAGSGPALVVPYRSFRTAPGLTDRYTQTKHELRASDDSYRLLVTSQQAGSRTTVHTPEGPMTRLAWRTWLETHHDSRGLPVESVQHLDATRTAITRVTFDPLGLPIHVVAPTQAAIGSTLGTSYAYDDHGVAPTIELDPLGRLVQLRHDRRTGALLERLGPDIRSTCAPEVPLCTEFQFEREQWSVDGFGRPTWHFASYDPPPGQYGYALWPDRLITYHDDELPMRIETARLRDLDTGVWILDDATFDGTGAVVGSVARRGVAGEPDAETSYAYDSAGDLRVITATDPRTDDGATVTTWYRRDGAGRVVQLARPDATAVAYAYDGLATTVTELDTDGTAGTTTTERRSVFGEVVAVVEHDNPSPGELATTTYHRDSLGRVDGVTDAEGSATTIAFDGGGNRTAVARGGKTWAYEYDLDGNVTAETLPGGTPATHRSITIYDVIGRPIVQRPASEGMSAGRLAELGIGDTTTTYTPLSGLPATVTLPFGSIAYRYDARGNVVHEARRVKSPVMAAAVEQWVDRAYDATGALRRVAWDDGTEWRYDPDPRGRVAAVRWLDPASDSFELLARYQRGTAGQPRSRVSDDAQRRDWSYDELGRVTYSRVWNPDAATTYAEHSYGFDGFGNVATMAADVDGMTQDVNYVFDATRRLREAWGSDGYAASLTYSATGNILTASIAGTAAPRDVAYGYGADPQAVATLTDQGTGNTVESLGYDAAGRMRQRATGAGLELYDWGSDGLLREVATPTAVVERYFFGPGAERILAVEGHRTRIWFGDSETHYDGDDLVTRHHHVAAGEPIARITNGTSIELQYADALDNLVVAVDRKGTVRAGFVYGAFGEVLDSVGGDDHRRQFNGKEQDAATGLAHYGYRSYDPLLLRWISADPIGTVAPDAVAPQLANRYSFAANNPVRFVDPDGRQAVPTPAPAPAPPPPPPPQDICETEPARCRPVPRTIAMAEGDQKTAGTFVAAEVTRRILKGTPYDTKDNQARVLRWLTGIATGQPVPAELVLLDVFGGFSVNLHIEFTPTNFPGSETFSLGSSSGSADNRTATRSTTDGVTTSVTVTQSGEAKASVGIAELKGGGSVAVQRQNSHQVSTGVADGSQTSIGASRAVHGQGYYYTGTARAVLMFRAGGEAHGREVVYQFGASFSGMHSMQVPMADPP